MGEPRSPSAQALLFAEDPHQIELDAKTLGVVRAHNGITASIVSVLLQRSAAETERSLDRLASSTAICRDRNGHYYRVT